MQSSTLRPPRSNVSKHESFNRQVSENCKLCQVNLFHCPQCKQSCHKKCPGHNNQPNPGLRNKRSRSYQKIHTGDEHWKKVLQTNDFELYTCRKHCATKPLSSPWSDREIYTNDFWAEKVKHNYNNKFDLRYFDYANSRDNSNVCSTSSSVSRTSSFASHFRSKSPTAPYCNRQNSQNFPFFKSQSRQSVSSPQKEKNVFHALVAKFVNWIGPNKQDTTKQAVPRSDSEYKNMTNFLTPPSNDASFTSKLSCNTLYEPDLQKLEQRRMRRRPKTMKISLATKTTLSTSESEMETFSPRCKHFHLSPLRWNKSQPISSCSSQIINTPNAPQTSSETNTNSKKNYLAVKLNLNLKKIDPSFQLTENATYDRNDYSLFKTSSDLEEKDKRKGFLSTSTVSTSNPDSSISSSLNSLSSQKSGENSSKESKEVDKMNTPVNAQDRRSKFRHINLSGYSMGYSKDTLINSSVEKDSVDISDNISMCSLLENCGPYLKETLQDCNIPFNDIKIKDVFKNSSVYSIYKGQWHGEVLVYFYNNLTEKKIPKFLQELRRLSRIRHEYIHLFMGASVNTSDIAIVMSELKGISVYDRIHTSSERLPTRTKINIARHVSQAIGYLHAKGFPVRTINSKNIYFDPKVKLSLLDQSLPNITYKTKGDAVYFSRGALTYLAPELLREIRPINIEQENDSYAYNNSGIHNYASISSYGNSFDSWLDDSLFTLKSDTYAFGTFLFEILSYQLPLKSLSSEEFIWQVCHGVRQKVNHLSCSSVLKVLIEKCWSQNPEERPSFIEINLELDSKPGLHKRHSSSQPERLNRPTMPMRSNSRLI